MIFIVFVTTHCALFQLITDLLAHFFRTNLKPVHRMTITNWNFKTRKTTNTSSKYRENYDLKLRKVFANVSERYKKSPNTCQQIHSSQELARVQCNWWLWPEFWIDPGYSMFPAWYSVSPDQDLRRWQNNSNAQSRRNIFHRSLVRQRSARILDSFPIVPRSWSSSWALRRYPILVEPQPIQCQSHLRSRSRPRSCQKWFAV